MKLLAKPSTTKARPVTSWKEIRADAFEMLELLNSDAFRGLYPIGHALSHAQVSDKPFDFFVTHRSWTDVLPRVICNVRIVDKAQKETVAEACLSYPHRGEKKLQRWWWVDVEFDVPPLDGVRSLLPFGLSHEHRGFDGLAAQIFQHEVEHAKGISLYQK